MYMLECTLKFTIIIYSITTIYEKLCKDKSTLDGIQTHTSRVLVSLLLSKPPRQLSWESQILGKYIGNATNLINR